MVSLRPLSESNREAVEALRVSPSQERFVDGVAASLRAAAEHPTLARCTGRYPSAQGFGTAKRSNLPSSSTSGVRPGVEVLTTSAGQGVGSPIAFYERYGFERTGEVSEDEVVLRLKLG